MSNDEYTEVPYVDDPDDPLFIIKDLEQFARFCLKPAFAMFTKALESESHPSVSFEEAESISDAELEAILPLEFAIDACKRKLIFEIDDDGKKNYLTNNKTMDRLLVHIAEEIHHYNSQQLVDEGILDMVYIAETGEVGYKAKGKPNDES